jgi:hypothetical protein
VSAEDRQGALPEKTLATPPPAVPTDAAAPSAADTPGADVPAPSPAVPAAATPQATMPSATATAEVQAPTATSVTATPTAASPYPPPRPLFGDRWPGPAGPIAGDLLACVVAFGVVLATAAPESPTGVGWLFTASVATAMTIMVAWGRRSRHPLTPADVGWTLLAVALTAVGTVRAADWLAALCLMAAAAAAALAVARRSFRSLTMSLLAPVIAAMRALPWVARGMRTGPRRLMRAGSAVLSAGLVLLVFVPLLAAADAAFSQVVDAVTPAIAVDSVVRWVFLFAFGTAAAAGAFFLLVAPPPEPYGADPRPTRLRLLDWAVPTGVLVAVLALFVGVQFVVLFGSDDYVLRTTGLTYAEYARSGFWQLLAVTALALGMLALGSRWAPARTPAERIAKRGLLAALALLTLVVVASAINRMWLYQQAYGFTVLRLLVLTCELWLGAGFLLALVAVLRLRPGGLSRPMVAVGMLALLGLAVLDAERFIAAHNVARWSETGKLDTSYLGHLSADAVPALIDLPPAVRDCILVDIGDGLATPDDWRSTNVAREAARAELDRLQPTCAGRR